MNETIAAHENNGRGHEQRDANVRAVVIFGIGLFILSVVVLLVIVFMLDYFKIKHTQSEAPLSPFAETRQLPPAPHLQVAPEVEWEKFHAAEDSLLDSYGWVVREAGVVRIPIDRAIDLVAQRGLPAKAMRIEDRGLKVDGRR
jgi:hypothetical protein